jgi:hypothetical protein
VIRPEPRGFGESVGPIDGATLRDNAADIAAAISTTSAAPAIVGGWLTETEWHECSQPSFHNWFEVSC